MKLRIWHNADHMATTAPNLRPTIRVEETLDRLAAQQVSWLPRTTRMYHKDTKREVCSLNIRRFTHLRMSQKKMYPLFLPKIQGLITMFLIQMIINWSIYKHILKDT